MQSRPRQDFLRFLHCFRVGCVHLCAFFQQPPNHVNRRPVEALGVVANTAVLPHYDTFGHKWVESAQEAAPDMTLLGVDERSAAVWDGATWLATGPGAVTVISGAKVERFASGERISGLQQLA